ncbi:MAG: DUF4292 domain-containing protein [Bacteroidales bacterium]
MTENYMNKRIPNTLFLCILSLIILVWAFACNPQKKIIKEPIKDKGADYLFEQLKKNEFRFDRLTVKFSADVSYNENNNSFNGNLRIRKDSAIWVSISPALGIEAARILITTDSVKFLNRLEATYFCGDFKYINKLLKTNLDFDMLQSLLVGTDFSYYENDVFKASVDGKQYLLSTVGRRKLKKHLKNTDDSLRILMQDIWLDPDNYKISKVHIKELKENRKLDVEYSEYEKVDNLLFPNKMEYVIINDKDKIEIKMENSKVLTSGSIQFPFNVSSKYKRINK